MFPDNVLCFVAVTKTEGAVTPGALSVQSQFYKLPERPFRQLTSVGLFRPIRGLARLIQRVARDSVLELRRAATGATEGQLERHRESRTSEHLRSGAFFNHFEELPQFVAQASHFLFKVLRDDTIFLND